MTPSALLLPLLLLASSASAGESVKFPRGTRQVDPANLALTISKDGAPGDVRCVDSQNLCDVLMNAVSRWKFEPARRHGVAESTPAFLTLSLVAVPREGGFGLRAVDAELALRGPTEETKAALPPPAYPLEAMRRGITGVVELELIIEPGQPTYRVGRRWFNGAEAKRRLQLVDASIEAAERMKVRRPPPELLSECVQIVYTFDAIPRPKPTPKTCKDSYVPGYSPPGLITDATQAEF